MNSGRTSTSHSRRRISNLMGKIEVSHLNVTYKQGNTAFKALNDIDFTIQAGEFVCIVGHSGCGKSTLLRVLSGLLSPDEGSVLIDGREVEGPGTDRAVVFQQYSLFPWMSARKNIIFGLEQVRPDRSKEERERIADKYLAKVGMSEAADKYPYQLSGGMRQRVAIARALAMDTEILLLDEPFGALDTRTRTSLQELLSQLWTSGEKKKTIVFVTHDIDEAILLADRILFMEPGKIAASMDVPFSRPRHKQELMTGEEFCSLRKKLVDWFYREDGGSDEKIFG